MKSLLFYVAAFGGFLLGWLMAGLFGAAARADQATETFKGAKYEPD